MIGDEAAHPVEEVRLGDRRGRRAAAVAPAGRPSTRTVARPRTVPRSIGPSTSAGASTSTLEPLAAVGAGGDACARRAAAARRRRSGSRGRRSPRPARTGTRLRYWAKPLSSSSRVSPSRASGVGAPITTEIRLDALAPAGADEDVAGVEGVAGLHAGHPGLEVEQFVDRRDPPRRLAGSEAALPRRRRSWRRRGRGAGARSASPGRRRSSSCRPRRARSGSRSGCRRGRGRRRAGSSGGRRRPAEPAAARARS